MPRTYIKELDRSHAQTSYATRTRNGYYTVTANTGATGTYDKADQVTRYARGRNECLKVGNLSRTHRVMRAMEATEREHELTAYKVQRFSRKQRRNLTK